MHFSRHLLLAPLLLAGSLGAAWAAPLPVVATFSILGDLAHQVGGDHVQVTTLVGADGDAHVYQPTPQDIRRVAQAKVLLSNGLGFEGWLDRLGDSAGFKGERIVASQGIHAQSMQEEEEGHGHDDHAQAAHDGHGHSITDPHAWNNPANVLIYIDNIAKGLSQADPANAADYQANAARYKQQLTSAAAAFTARFAALPAERRIAITSHDAFGYLAQAFHLTLLSPQGLSTDAEPSAAQVAQLIRQIRQQKAPALFVENISDPRLMEQIARETGTRIGGKLYSDALSGPQGDAPTYLAMMQHNLSTLLKALEP